MDELRTYIGIKVRVREINTSLLDLIMRIDGTGFGYIVVNGTRYDHDVVITDKVLLRRKELSYHLRERYGHTPLTGEELRSYFGEYKPEVVIIGTGQYGSLPLAGVEEAAEELGVKLIIEKTPKAIETYNKLKDEKKNVAAILHVTC